MRALENLRSKEAPAPTPPARGEIFGLLPTQLLGSELMNEPEITPEMTEAQDVINMTVDHTETAYDSEGKDPIPKKILIKVNQESLLINYGCKVHALDEGRKVIPKLKVKSIQNSMEDSPNSKKVTQNSQPRDKQSSSKRNSHSTKRRDYKHSRGRSYPSERDKSSYHEMEINHQCERNRDHHHKNKRDDRYDKVRDHYNVRYNNKMSLFYIKTNWGGSKPPPFTILWHNE